MNIAQLYEQHKKKYGTNMYKYPICGNINENGWEVWTGVNVRSLDFIDLKKDLQSATISKKCNGIDDTK